MQKDDTCFNQTCLSNTKLMPKCYDTKKLSACLKEVVKQKGWLYLLWPLTVSVYVPPFKQFISLINTPRWQPDKTRIESETYLRSAVHWLHFQPVWLFMDQLFESIVCLVIVSRLNRSFCDIDGVLFVKIAYPW